MRECVCCGGGDNETSKDQCICIKFSEGTYDSGYYIYCFELNGPYANEILLDGAVDEMLAVN